MAREYSGGDRTIVHVLQEAVHAFPDRPWIRGDRGDVTFEAVDLLSTQIAHGLLAAGLSASDTLLVMLPDSVEQISIWVACAKLGIIEVPVNTAYRGDILVHIANDCGSKIAIIGQSYLERFGALHDQLITIERIFVFDDGDTTPDAGAGIPGRTIAPFASLISSRQEPIQRIPAESDVMAIMYTSGTTGGSKGVMVSHAHAFEYAVGCARALELNETDIYYTSGLPLFHVAGKWGVIFASAIFGASAVVPRQFSVRTFWDDVRRFGVTATYLLGVMANFLQRQPADPSDGDNPMRKVLMCPLLPDSAAFAQRFDLSIATAYGSTEVNAPISMALGTPVSDSLIVGKVRADKFEIMIGDENDNPVPPDVVGEILVRPKQPWITMLGYWKQPERTVSMWRNLWLHSGDAGRYDTEGNLYFIDRIQDTIRRRGENISSMEVEGILSQHPAVSECAVYPVRSEHTEQEVMAAFVLKTEATAPAEDLVGFAAQRMPYFMVPRFIIFMAELPKTPTGKIRKNVLREAGLTPATWDREAAGIKIKR